MKAIIIPDGWDVIEEGDNLILKPSEKKPQDTKPRSWETFCEQTPRKADETFISSFSEIIDVSAPTVVNPRDPEKDKNVNTSREESEAFLALMQLRQLRKAWVGEWEPKGNEDKLFGIIFYDIDRKIIDTNYGSFTSPGPLTFPNGEMADDFRDCFLNLLEKAKILI